MVYEGQELNHAFGLCHYKQFLFWNEYRGGSIYKLDQVTKTVTLLRNERPPIFEIRVYDAHQQQGMSFYSFTHPSPPVTTKYDMTVLPLFLVCLCMQEPMHVELTMAAVAVCVSPFPAGDPVAALMIRSLMAIMSPAEVLSCFTTKFY